MYLLQHPDGEPGQHVVMDQRAHEVAAMLSGALTDLLSGLSREPQVRWYGHILNVEHFKHGLRVTGAVTREGVLRGPGAVVLKHLSRHWRTRKGPAGAKLLSFEIDSQHLVNRVRMLPSL
jgi:hypothetical protein